MDCVQPADPDPVLDRIWAVSERQQLPARHPAVLAVGQRSQPPIVLVEFGGVFAPYSTNPPEGQRCRRVWT
jgi:hypothetical protein